MRVRFGEFAFDAATRELTGAEGVVRLSTKAFRLLELLIVEAPRALTKEELYRHIWGNAFVEEANLPNLISEIRAALGETRKEALFIKTVHGYGYAFCGELHEEPRGNPRNRADSIYALQWRKQELPLRAGENVVGRSDGADVAIDSGAVSRRHARIVVDAAGVTIEDLGSKNGTFVRDQRITTRTPVHDGDEIRFGMIAVTFRISDRGASTVTGMEDRSARE